MSTFEVALEIADLARRRWYPLRALVDTGSTLSTFPLNVLTDLGITADGTRLFAYLDGRRVEREVGAAWVRVGDRAAPTPITFGVDGDTILLGALTLEALFLGVDPIQQALIPIAGLRHQA